MGIPTGGTDPMLGIGTDHIMAGTLTGMTPIGIHLFLGTDTDMPVSMGDLAFIVRTTAHIGITAHTGMAITETDTIIMVITVAEI